MADCPRHPGVPATDLCVVCGESVCGQCGYVREDQQVACPSCRGRLPRVATVSASPDPRVSRKATPVPGEPVKVGAAPKRSGLAVVALICACFGCFCTPVWVVGLVLGFMVLQRVADGRLPKTNRGMALWAVMGNTAAGALNLWVMLHDK